MGEFKQASTADGSWAHPPGEEVEAGAMLAGPFVVQEMPARPPARKPPSEKTQKLLRGVAPADGEEDE